jgi:hypothetical protein
MLYIPLDHPAIQYGLQPPDDVVARLNGRLESGKARLEFAPSRGGYLPAILRELGINVDSQTLVFSRTSIQGDKISPQTPRALYFNDEASVGYVQNGDLELSALDPERGVYFYTLRNSRADKPVFARRQDCLRCHQGPVTLGAPGLLVSSVRPRAEGTRGLHGGADMTDHRIPFSRRWGGWYVTGTHGSQRHLGNNVALVNPLQPGPPAGDETQNLESVSEFFDASRYLAPTSDIVALMTLEHQTRMTNLMVRIGWDARIAVLDGKFGGEVEKQINAEIEEMVGYMLFADEEPLSAPVAGVSTFTKTFAERGPRDEKGRSLRDFDLQTRIFRYPLSYMIYTEAWDKLPEIARMRAYRRLHEVLTGKDQGKKFARLSAEDRRAALEIVRATKPNLPRYWTEAAPSK